MIGGPLDGLSRDKRSSPTFIWTDQQMRFSAERRAHSELYRAWKRVRDRDNERVQLYLFAGYTHASCCGAFYQVEASQCIVCGEPLRRTAPA